MTPKEIKAAMILQGITQVTIAKKAGISQALVCNTIKGIEKNPRVRRTIASALGKPVREIWPEYRPERELRKVVGG